MYPLKLVICYSFLYVYQRVFPMDFSVFCHHVSQQKKAILVIYLNILVYIITIKWLIVLMSISKGKHLNSTCFPNKQLGASPFPADASPQLPRHRQSRWARRARRRSPNLPELIRRWTKNGWFMLVESRKTYGKTILKNTPKKWNLSKKKWRLNMV
jgi:hypothetical protein